MSDNISTIAWDDIPELDLPAFRLEISEQIEGKVQIYKVPKNDKEPEGYYVTLNTSTNPYVSNEPPYKAKDVVHLCTIRFDDIDMDVDGYTLAKAPIQRTVMYCHPSVKIDPIKLNPELKDKV